MGKEKIMRIIKEADFRKEIKSNPANAYLFFGDEDYMKAHALKTAREAICPDPSFAFFNDIHIDAFSYSPEALMDSFMSLPMMADRKLITVTGLDIGAMRQNQIDDLCAVLAKLEEYDSNTVILYVAADKIDPGRLPRSPSSVLKKIGEYATAVHFERNSLSKLSLWLQKHFEHNGVSISPCVAGMMIERCGRDMFNLAAESEKLSFYVKAHERDAVSEDDLLTVTVPAIEYDGFAFSNAICARRRDEALEILRDMKTRRLEPVMIMSEISKNLCEMATVISLKESGFTQKEVSEITGIHEYRISLIFNLNPRAEVCRDMIKRCREADRELKNTYDGYRVIEKLICIV